MRSVIAVAGSARVRGRPVGVVGVVMSEIQNGDQQQRDGCG
jgi:hypothetical protein